MRRQALRQRERAFNFPLLFLILSFILVAPALVASAEPTQPPAEQGGNAATPVNFVAPGDMNTGALLLKSGEDGQYIEAPRLNTDVAIAVTGTIARAVVTQRFENPSDRWLEGVYVFPLPEQSAVDALRMEIGSRVIEAQIKGRDEARKLYDEAKDAGQKASLVEQERPNIFTNSVANIGPHESIIIRIEYQETVKQDAGVYSLRFPLVVAPRYNPKPQDVNLVDYDGPRQQNADPVPDRDRISPPVLDPKFGKINRVSLQVTLDAGFDLGDVKSSFHPIALKRTGDGSATLALADGTVPADKDFELVWSPKAATVPQTSLFHEAVGGEDYWLAMVTPPSLETDRPALPREIVLVIDNSGSMAGTSITQAKQSLLFALGRLRPGDRFNVVRFDDTMETLFDGPVDATSENLAIAKHFVSRLDAEGGTEMLPALKAALADASPSDTSHVRQVVFLTDGAVGNEAQLFAEIASNRGRSRLFTVGIGSAPNSYFMRRAAELGRGTFTEIGSEAQVLERMTALFAKLEKPVLVGLKAEWQGPGQVEAWPDPLPDLYAGEPVVVSAKGATPKGQLHLSGTFEGKPWATTLKLSEAVVGQGVGKLWARSKIASLEGKIYADASPTETAKAIETVALAHHLVSSETSLVAVDTSKSRPDGTAVTTTDMPVNLPDGWQYDKVFGGPPTQQAMAPSRGYMAKGSRIGGSFAALPAPSPVPSYAPRAMPSPGDVQADAMAAPEADMQGTSAGGLAEPDPGVTAFDGGEAPQPEAAEPQAATPEPAEPQAATSEPATPQLSVPQVAAPADHARQFGIFALLLAILSTVTLLVWRYHRRDYTSPRRIGRRI
jgi:Ca-activated chloride channel family protein